MAGVLSNIISNGVASITGKVAKATIYVKDNREEWEEQRNTIAEAVSAGSNMTSSLGGLQKKVKVNGLDVKGRSAPVRKLDEITGGKLGLDPENKLAVAMANGYNKVFEVQFNPDSLELSGTDYGSSITYNFSNSKEDKSSNSGINMTLNVKLVFVKDDLSEAFPSDMMALNATQGANAVMKFAKSKMDMFNKKPSVQVTVEGFIGALVNNKTKEVAFGWGDHLFYEGILKNVNASYTVFDTAGRPVRADVQLSIYLRDKEFEGKEKPVQNPSLGIWQDAYDKAFSDNSSYIGTIQKKIRDFTKFTGG